MDVGNCENCAAWQVTSTDRVRGECHRFAPSNRRLADDGIVEWPVTLFDHWCGDWVEKNDASPLA